jgi:hypothetical protein
MSKRVAIGLLVFAFFTAARIVSAQSQGPLVDRHTGKINPKVTQYADASAWNH